MKIYISIMGFIGLFLTVLGGMLLALPFATLSLVVGVILAIILHERQKALELQRYAEQIDNIYITNIWEDDNTVLARAQYAEMMLEKANNQQNVKVHKIYFQYGEHINETWEMYLERAEAFIKADRAERHKELAAKGGSLYEKFWLQQKNLMEGQL